MTLPDARILPDWLSSYINWTSNLEAPERLHMWSGLAIIAAALRRNVALDMDYDRVYPNLYIIIVAESARVRKSIAMDHARNLFMDAVPQAKIMRDSMTSQGLIKALNHKSQVIVNDKIREELRSDVAIFADEIANLFSYDKLRASQMAIFLTRAYGCPDIYDHTTARDATVRLFNLYPVVLGGTDPRNLKVLPDDAVGGLTGRLIWIIEKSRRSNNPGWQVNELAIARRELMREYLIHDLRRISQLQGKIQVSLQARDYYDKWYNKLAAMNIQDPAVDAFYNRCHTTALRIAILLSISESDDLLITHRHMAAAIELIEQQIPAVKQAIQWSGGSIYEQARAKLVHLMQQNPNGAVAKRTALRYMGMPMDEFEKLIGTLMEDGTILRQTRKLGTDEAYFLSKEAKDESLPKN